MNDIDMVTMVKIIKLLEDINRTLQRIDNRMEVAGMRVTYPSMGEG